MVGLLRVIFEPAFDMGTTLRYWYDWNSGLPVALDIFEDIVDWISVIGGVVGLLNVLAST